MTYVCRPFSELTVYQLHDLLRLRCDVFVVEQACVYPDIDGQDPHSRHLLGYAGGRLELCCRWYEESQGEDGGSVVLGRIVTSSRCRGQGLGAQLMREALERIGPRRVMLSAQAHLEDFYHRFGFNARGEPYDDAGIPHVDMVRPAPPA